jgi:hypothetical protein
MELLITYSPSGKTKYFNVLLESGEILAARTKKAALYILQTLQKKLDDIHNRTESFGDVDCEKSTEVYPGRNTHDDSDVPLRHDDGTGKEIELSSEGEDYTTFEQFKDIIGVKIASLDRSNRIIKARAVRYHFEAQEHGRRAQEHGRRAQEHGRRAQEHGRRVEQYEAELQDHLRDAELIKRYREEFVDFLSQLGVFAGGSEPDSVSQQFDDEKEMRRIVPIDVVDC